MASIDYKYGEKNNIISCRIRVHRGRDPITKKQLKPWTMTWALPEEAYKNGWSNRTIKSRIDQVARDFERDCHDNKVETKEQRFERLQREQQEAERKVTLRRYVEETFMPRKSIEFSQNAIDSYNNSFVRIFKYLGDLKVEDISKKDIKDFLTALQTKETVIRGFRGGKTVKTDKPLAYDTIIKHYVVLHSVLSEAYKADDIIPTNPMDKVDRPQPRKDDEIKEAKAYTVDEARYILECLSKEPLQWRTMIHLMLDTGARRGEVAGLQWKNVNFDNSTIRIANNLQYSPAKGVYNTTTKGKKNRTIDVGPDVMGLMRLLKDSQKVQTVRGYCFIQADGSPLHPQTPTKHLEAFGKKYGIKDLHPHALRHTAATIAITHGADVASVGAKLGHAESSTTLNMYTHADQEAIKRSNGIYRDALYQKKDTEKQA